MTTSIFSLRKGYRDIVARYKSYGWSNYGSSFRNWAESYGRGYIESRNRVLQGNDMSCLPLKHISTYIHEDKYE